MLRQTVDKKNKTQDRMMQRANTFRRHLRIK